MTMDEADRILKLIEADATVPLPAKCLERQSSFMVQPAIMHELLMAWKAVRNAGSQT